MHGHEDAIRGTEASPFENAGFRATRKGKLLYAFVPEWPASRELVLPGVRVLPRRAGMLGDAGQVPLAKRQTDSGVAVSLPERASDPVCSVVACEFDTPVKVSGAASRR
jgi:alpha-L-fucosidase